MSNLKSMLMQGRSTHRLPL